MTKEELDELSRLENKNTILYGRSDSSGIVQVFKPSLMDYIEDLRRLMFLEGKKEGWKQGRKAYRNQLMSRIRDSQNKRWNKIQDE